MSAGIRILAAGALLVLAATASRAATVHGGGVGACHYCHVAHDESAGGGGWSPGGPALLRGTASDVCLSCHAAAYGAVLGDDPLAPPPERGAGNFVFLREDNLNDGPDGVAAPIPGDAAGHNLRAPAHALSTDGTRTMSPGGSYPSLAMRCTSCHDPHGNRNYRFLRGPGPAPGGATFVHAAPDAEGLDIVIGEPESDARHVAYRSGMSRWCGNCHDAYLQDHGAPASGFAHPTDRVLDAAAIEQYNVYNGTADPAGGLAGMAYLAAVPFEDAGADVTATWGPTGSSRLTCLSCHRAHASSSPAAGRWDFRVARLGEDGVVSGSHPLPNPYGDPAQRPHCHKCHAAGAPE